MVEANVTAQIPSNIPVYVYLILDESSSMENVRLELIEGINEYIDTLKKDVDVVYYVTLVKFSNQVTTVYANKPLSEVEPLTTNTYAPNGMTALWDGIGITVYRAKNELSGEYKSVVVVNTDGHENSSKEYKDTTKLKTLISELEATGQWTFTYLGADMNAWGVAQQLGGTQANSFNYRKGATRAMYSTVGQATSRMALAGAACMSDASFFKDEDRLLYAEEEAKDLSDKK